jgi:HK97 family phage portal protein
MKAAGLTFVPQWLRHSFMSVAWTVLLKQGLKGNATAYACATLLARTFPEPELWPWQTTAEGEYEKIINHPHRDLMSKPNGDMGEAELLAFCVVYAAVGGNIYLWKQRNNAGQVIGFWPFHDGDMQPIPGITTEEGLVAYYVLDTGDGRTGNPFGVNRHDNVVGVAIPKADVIHWKWMIDPEQPWRGIGALEASINDSQVANEIRAYIYSLLKNDAKPPIVINLAEGEEYDEDKAERLRTQWLQRYGGSNRGTPAFLEFGMNVKELGFDLQQLEIDSLRDGPDAAICMGFGIHPAVVGALVGLKHSTYSNFEEARRALTEQTLIPLWRSFASEVEQAMRDEKGYGPAVRIRFDIAQVRALTENQTAVREFALNAFNASLITRAAALQMLGMKSGPVDEVYKVGLTTTFLPAGQAMALPGAAGATDGKELVLWQRRDGSGHQNGRMQKAADEPPCFDWDWGEIHMLDYKSFPQGSDGAQQLSAPANQIAGQRTAIARLRDVREALLPKAETAVARYFAAYAGRVAAALEVEKNLTPAGNGRALAAKELTQADVNRLYAMIYGQEDAEGLLGVIEEIQLAVALESWGVLNLLIDSAGEFDRSDQAVALLLQTAGQRVHNITDSTREMLQTHLQRVYTGGWSINDVVNGRSGLPGIKEFIAETYQGRNRAIARTEIGTAQQAVAVGRYKGAGADGVIVFDNGFENSHPTCQELDGTVQTLEWAAANPLQHPNCVRAFGAWFKD